MTIAKWLIDTMIKLRDTGVDSPRRDALVLLEDTIGKDRTWVTTHPEYVLEADVLERVDKLVQRRMKREPLAYIRGKAWFYGRFFEVSPSVLIPRPESESFIELSKKLSPSKIIDVGTGSGALAITAKLELSDAEVIATDNSSAALEIAQKNAHAHKVHIQFLSGNLLEPLDGTSLKHSVILANLPYVPIRMITSSEIAEEPSEALFSGKDGLNHYQELWQQIADLPTKPRYVLTESLETQHQALAKLAKNSGYTAKQTSVLVQVFELSTA